MQTITCYVDFMPRGFYATWICFTPQRLSHGFHFHEVLSHFKTWPEIPPSFVPTGAISKTIKQKII